MRSTKMVDASALLALAKPDVENEARTVDPNVAPENDPSPKGNWNTLEGPQSLQMYGNGEENVMNKKEDDHSDIRSLQGQPLYPSNQGDTIEPHSDVDGHSSKGSKESEKEAQSPISKKEEPKEVDHPMIPHKRYTPKNVVERVEQLEKRLDEVVQSMHQLITLTGTLLKDDRKAIRDLASHSTYRTGKYEVTKQTGNRKTPKARNSHASHWAIPIQPKSFFLRKTKSIRKDETVIPSPQSQGPTTCGIQPVHLTTLPTLSEVGEHTVPKTQPKLMSNFRNLDDQCSSDKEKAEYCTNRCVTLKRKIQELGHSELEVPTMVQARKPSMHTVPMKKARSTLGFRANGPSRDQTERTISRSTGAWIPHRQG
uniref:Uncharacterized protein n=1 Tax=Fagus sylvatica TaxID=28930 RepID=A0A2N9HW87_FAGSY